LHRACFHLSTADHQISSLLSIIAFGYRLCGDCSSGSCWESLGEKPACCSWDFLFHSSGRSLCSAFTLRVVLESIVPDSELGRVGTARQPLLTPPAQIRSSILRVHDCGAGTPGNYNVGEPVKIYGFNYDPSVLSGNYWLMGLQVSGS
jgi:hypothetical protein